MKKKITVNPTRTSREQFLKVYAKALKLGWSREQCAEELGIKPESVYARCLVEKANGNHIRPLPVASRRVNEDEINALLAEVCVPSGAVKEDDTDDTDEVEAVTDDQVAAALEFLE
jgi:hypothetical protein